MRFTEWLAIPDSRVLRDGTVVASVEQPDGKLRRVKYVKEIVPFSLGGVMGQERNDDEETG
jgi:hypothetical protein